MTVLGLSFHTAVETLYLFFSINDILQIHLEERCRYTFCRRLGINLIFILLLLLHPHP
ncbi:unnamed protein product, partial [Staurois parvus]